MKVHKTLGLLVLLGLGLFGCNSKERKAADALLRTADSLFLSENYDDAILLLDSINKTFPKEIDARRSALEKLKEVKMARSRKDSLEVSVRLDELIVYSDSLYNHFDLIEAPGMPDENIIRYRGYNPSLQNAQASFLDCYVDYDGTLVLVASTSATKTLGVRSIKVSNMTNDTYLYSDTIPYDGGNNYRFEDLGRVYERLTFRGEKAYRIASFIANTSEGVGVRITFEREDGGQGPSFVLSKAAVEAVTYSYRYAVSLDEMKDINRRLETHNKRLQLRGVEEMKSKVGDLR